MHEEKDEIIILKRGILLGEYKKSSQIDLGEKFNEEIKRTLLKRLKILKNNNMNVMNNSLKLTE